MAQDDSRFSHISVSAGDEDDVVIVAGDARAQASSRAAEPVVSPKPEPVSERVREGEGEPAAAPRKSAPARPEAPKRSSARDRYEETTLDDLQNAKMSSMQKAIIVVAAIGVIAFAVYYLFLR